MRKNLALNFVPLRQEAAVGFPSTTRNTVIIGTGSALSKSTWAVSHTNSLLAAGGGFSLSKEQDIAALKADAGDGIAALTLPLNAFFTEAADDDEKKDAGLPQRRFVTIAALSDVCSRNNAPGRPDLIPTALGKAGKKSAISLVHLVVEHVDQVFSAGLAVARAFPMYSAKKNNGPLVDMFSGKTIDVVVEVIGDRNGLHEQCQILAEAADSVRLAARLVDSPTCEVGVDFMVEEARQVAATLKALVPQEQAEVKVDVIRGEELKTKGFGGIWGVGKAAVEKPAFVHLSYIPKSPVAEKIAFIGKGIVYDTGGLALKTAEGMFGMKGDMAGSAGVLYAFNAAVKTAFDLNAELHALLCLAENAIGPESYRNGDVLRMLSGKTVEVNNTDAEGRLVLADGIFYASSVLKATTIVDMATLTGAQGIATGQRHAALYCNDDELESAAVAAGKRSGDLVHPLPYAPEFFKEEFSSPIADMRNSVKNRFNASSACAGQFLANHLDASFGGRFLHIDMAYPAHKGDLSTGYGVGLLTTLIHKNLRTLKLLK